MNTTITTKIETYIEAERNFIKVEKAQTERITKYSTQGEIADAFTITCRAKYKVREAQEAYEKAIQTEVHSQ